MMTPPEAEIVFSESEHEQFERDLSAADQVLRTLASSFGCRIHGNAGKGWPGRELFRRKGLRTFVLRLQLNPNFLEDNQVYYQIATQWSFRFGEILTRVLRHKVETRFTREKLANPEWLRAELLRILGQNLKSVTAN